LSAGQSVDKEIKAIHHGRATYLHSIGLGHNGINPGNIMVDDERSEQVQVYFGSCYKIGDRWTLSRGITG